MKEMIQCPEAKCVPANSIQSSGFIEFGDEAPHMFSGPMDGRLHLITPQQGGAEHNVILYFFFESQKVFFRAHPVVTRCRQREKDGLN